jgi:hypothetical protein
MLSFFHVGYGIAARIATQDEDGFIKICICNSNCIVVIVRKRMRTQNNQFHVQLFKTDNGKRNAFADNEVYDVSASNSTVRVKSSRPSGH